MLEFERVALFSAHLRISHGHRRGRPGRPYDRRRNPLREAEAHQRPPSARLHRKLGRGPFTPYHAPGLLRPTYRPRTHIRLLQRSIDRCNASAVRHATRMRELPEGEAGVLAHETNVQAVPIGEQGLRRGRGLSEAERTQMREA